MNLRSCERCDKPVRKWRPKARFCSKQCSGASRIRRAPCLTCGAIPGTPQRKYCSAECYATNRREPFELRFWRNVKRPDDPSNCWVWTGTMCQGYGVIRAGDRQRKAHRISWEMHNGPIADSKLHVCHRCDNPACISPLHLFLGRAIDNVRDMDAKGRRFMTRWQTIAGRL